MSNFIHVIRLILLRPRSRATVIRLVCAVTAVFFILVLLSSRRNELDYEDSVKRHRHHIQPNQRIQLRSAAPSFDLSAKDRDLFYKLNPFIPSWGADGKGVTLTSKKDKKEAEKLFKSGAFNVFISDRISPNRTLPEARPDECSPEYDNKPNLDRHLPTTSVIIIFTDEIWSALIRTIWSVVNRSPPHLLKEIILVDDFSKRPELKEPLDTYAKYYFGSKVSILRTSKREGLIRARIMGAKAATGDVLLFLDSHCEVTTGWLQPLLRTIKEDRRNVVCPVIDVISDKNLEYSVGDRYYFQVGGFTWSGHFNWIDIPEDFTKKHPTQAVESPTMAGGLFAMERSYFFEIGSYDEAMEIWGGENLEMSFRIWMCGGRLLIHPCSHVGHIFRDYHPYSFQGKDTHGINTLRTILVWMDSEYHKYFFMYRGDLKGKRAGDLSQRFKLKKSLGCKSFRWFLENVFKGRKFVYDQKVQGYGTFRNPASGLCLDILNHDEEKTSSLGVYSCVDRPDDSYTNQVFSLTNNGEIRREETCAAISDERDDNTDDKNDSSSVVMTKCIEIDLADEVRKRSVIRDKKKQTWIHYRRNSVIKNAFDDTCLTTKGLKSSDDVLLAPCDSGDRHQWWVIQIYS